MYIFHNTDSYRYLVTPSSRWFNRRNPTESFVEFCLPRRKLLRISSKKTEVTQKIRYTVFEKAKFADFSLLSTRLHFTFIIASRNLQNTMHKLYVSFLKFLFYSWYSSASQIIFYKGNCADNSYYTIISLSKQFLGNVPLFVDCNSNLTEWFSFFVIRSLQLIPNGRLLVNSTYFSQWDSALIANFDDERKGQTGKSPVR